MKIGLVIYGSPETVSGGYLYDRKLVAHLRQRGDAVEIVSLPTGSYSTHLMQNLGARLPRGLDVLIEDELVHPSLLVANRLRRSIPVLSLVHNLRSSENRAAWQNTLYGTVERLHLRSVDGFIFNSEATRESVARLVGGVHPHVIAPPGGDRLGTITTDALERRLARRGPVRLLFLANVTPLKGLHVLLDALSSMPDGTCALDVAGSLQVEPAYAARMQRQAGSLRTPVRFHGVLDAAALTQLLMDSDALVLPSFYEGFGIAYLEGMAFGLPALGTTAGAIPRTVADGHNGYLISPGDSAALAARLAQLAADRALLATLSRNALNYFRSRPTWTDSAEMIRRFLEERLDAASRPEMPAQEEPPLPPR